VIYHVSAGEPYNSRNSIFRARHHEQPVIENYGAKSQGTPSIPITGILSEEGARAGLFDNWPTRIPITQPIQQITRLRASLLQRRQIEADKERESGRRAKRSPY